MQFISPTRGRMNLDELCNDIIGFIKEDDKSEYTLIIGTDSQPGNNVCFVTAIIIYRKGKGARYYYRRFFNKKVNSLRQRIVMEATYSLDVANQVYEIISQKGYEYMNVEIHLDVGEKGKTRDIVKEVVSMVTGCGFLPHVKPDAYGASKVADKHSKYAI
ncbi:ribonuclease H-like YkuK family protein [Caldanaerobius polysaccharolyticus]|uniref:ribonuclease H-like YkuK family protein n=1 Tax=Caldanaerobius polysaccharolyticus TaxID=44256 RepID=UPI0004788F81|nr:ribonuclease H-like YkuK family protein [Caldanaerobius polysaccharolyticus]